jgi:tetratricopeptide (TPR) repeat protein
MRQTLILVALLTGCATERPVFHPRLDRFADLKHFPPPEIPALDADDTEDEAEIQFRAAFAFYRTARWDFAAAAFKEALDYNEDRHDIRYFLASSLLLASRELEAVVQLEELLDTPLAPAARPVLARALFRLGLTVEARAACLPAITENYDAAGWVARYDLLLSPPR